MTDLVINWFTYTKRCLSKFFSDERAITTMDWIGLTAAVVLLVTAIIVFFQTQGCTAIGVAVGDSLQAQIDAWR